MITKTGTNFCTVCLVPFLRKELKYTAEVIKGMVPTPNKIIYKAPSNGLPNAIAP